ncbi:MAG TPA: P-II family nitrogen regulator [Dehalococcoidia bacterium]|nr:P-II family nitrogen regulator [Dehalococcoidia bacterium]
MKMVQAVVRPEKEEAVAEALARAGFPALTKWDVVGRGRQQGVQVGSQMYEELAKALLFVVVEDGDAEAVARTILEAASSGYPGDGKVFIGPVEAAYTVRTGKSEL